MGRLLSILAFLILASFPAWGQTITGPAKVLDGDTIEVAGQRIRLHGIDAPESKQTCMIKRVRWPCGKEATALPRGLVGDSPVRCVQKDKDRYGRIVAVCWNPSRDLNETMVLAGMALAYKQFSFDYLEAEDKARLSKIGSGTTLEDQASVTHSVMTGPLKTIRGMRKSDGLLLMYDPNGFGYVGAFSPKGLHRFGSW